MGASKFFHNVKNKASSGIQAVNKVVDKAPAILNKTSNVLDKAGNIAGKVSNISGKILENPLVAGFVAANPELLPAYGAAVGASKLIGQGAKLADKGSSAASRGAGVASKASNVLEKVNTNMSRPQAVTFA
jgi:hypothetical protein